MTTAIIVALVVANVTQAIAYRRLKHAHVRTVGALWASTLDRSNR